MKSSNTKKKTEMFDVINFFVHIHKFSSVFCVLGRAGESVKAAFSYKGSRMSRNDFDEPFPTLFIETQYRINCNYPTTNSTVHTRTANSKKQSVLNMKVAS